MTDTTRFFVYTYRNQGPMSTLRERMATTRLTLVALRWFLAFLFFLFATRAGAETSVLVGPGLVHSTNLGYVENYLGARGEVESRGDRLVLRGDLSAYDSKKVETDDGFGFRLAAMAGVRIGNHVSVLAGAQYRRQSTSAWSKDGLAPRVEVEFSGKRGLLRLGVERLDEPDDQQTDLSVEVRTGKRFQLFVRGEWIEYETLFAKGNGQRYEIGMLFRVGGGR